MNLQEAATLSRMVKAVCPSQKIDSETPTAWEMVLYDVSARDAVEAVKRLARRPTDPDKARYIEPGHIRGEVERIRRERLDNHPEVEPPSDLQPREFLAWLRDTRQRIADGEIITPPSIERRPMPELGSLLRSVDDEL